MPCFSMPIIFQWAIFAYFLHAANHYYSKVSNLGCLSVMTNFVTHFAFCERGLLKEKHLFLKTAQSQNWSTAVCFWFHWYSVGSSHSIGGEDSKDISRLIGLVGQFWASQVHFQSELHAASKRYHLTTFRSCLPDLLAAPARFSYFGSYFLNLPTSFLQSIYNTLLYFNY